MTVIDDEVLGTLLKETGSSFEVPEGGADEILERASGQPAGVDDEDESELPPEEVDGPLPSGFHRLPRFIGDHRLLSVAACVAVVAVALGSAWLGTSHQPRRAATSKLQGPHVVAPGQLTTVSEGVFEPGAHAATGKAATTAAPVGGYDSGPSKETSTVQAPTGTKLNTTGAAAPALSSGAYGSTTAGTFGSKLVSGTTLTVNEAKSSATPSSPSLPTGEVGQSSKIEQTGSLSLVVAKGDLSKTVTELASLATFFDGFVAKSQSQSGTGGATPGATVTVQVPVSSFTGMLKRAQGLGHTAALSTKATDVTGVYVNLQAQITALQATLQQYLTIMTKATSVGDILSVQAQINTVQSQIQQLQGQLQVIDDETTYSTLTVAVDVKGAPVPVKRHHTTTSGLAKAWHDSVHGFVVAVEGLIRVAGPLLFVLLCAAAVILGARIGWRRYRRHTL